jgi:hypothetical protein
MENDSMCRGLRHGLCTKYAVQPENCCNLPTIGDFYISDSYDAIGGLKLRIGHGCCVRIFRFAFAHRRLSLHLINAVSAPGASWNFISTGATSAGASRYESDTELAS